MPKVLKIERPAPPPGAPEIPLLTPRGFKLADPVNGRKKHHAKHAVYAATLDEAAELVEKHGFSIWLKQEGKWPTLISPGSLRIVRS